MKIGYFADGPWSHEAINLIVNCSSLDVSFIVPRFDTQDPILKHWAERLNIPFLPFPNVNTPQVVDQLKSFEADIYVSMSFNQILKKEIIESPPLGFINCHAGALPFYRGRNPLNWVLINGEKSFGITVHYIDEGIDTGDILNQATFPIKVNDTYGDLLEKATFECGKLLHHTLLTIRDNSHIRTKQTTIHPIGTYFGRRVVGDEWLNFDWSSERIHNFVRGITHPGPGARLKYQGREYAVFSSKLIENAPSYIATNGEVVGRTQEGVIVKSDDSTLLFTEMAEIEGNMTKEPFTPNFKIGTRFNWKDRYE